MTTLYAQPYDISATGFYFESAEEFSEKIKTIRNDCGNRVEEFEIQFIDGEEIDAELAKTWGLHQGNFIPFLEAVEAWEFWQKLHVIIAVGEYGYSFDPSTIDPESFEIDVTPAENLQAFARDCVEDGWFGSVPEALAPYIDYDAVARDLGIDYCEITIAGESFVYACR